jgi:hypothetical protein
MLSLGELVGGLYRSNMTPIKLQKGEKLTNVITHAFTINEVPHVFGEHHFAGHKYKYMEDFTKRRFSTLICPPNQLKMG